MVMYFGVPQNAENSFSRWKSSKGGLYFSYIWAKIVSIWNISSTFLDGAVPTGKDWGTARSKREFQPTVIQTEWPWVTTEEHSFHTALCRMHVFIFWSCELRHNTTLKVDNIRVLSSGCDVVQSCTSLSIFRRDILPPVSRSKCKPKK
jgi:hypothetical protein